MSPDSLTTNPVAAAPLKTDQGARTTDLKLTRYPRSLAATLATFPSVSLFPQLGSLISRIEQLTRAKRVGGGSHNVLKPGHGKSVPVRTRTYPGIPNFRPCHPLHPWFFPSSPTFVSIRVHSPATAKRREGGWLCRTEPRTAPSVASPPRSKLSICQLIVVFGIRLSSHCGCDII